MPSFVQVLKNIFLDVTLTHLAPEFEFSKSLEINENNQIKG